jgi:DNA helicase-2/ATP-dependent DNA helicase PcrA
MTAELKPSKYQLAVYDHLAKMAGNSAVISVAGSGKTTTAIEGLGYIPDFIRVLLGAFNVSIRDEFKQRGDAKGYRHVRYANYNGFGWGICLNAMSYKPALDKEKTTNILEFNVLRPNTTEEVERLQKWKNPVKRIVSLMKNLNYHTMEEVTEAYPEIVDRYNIEVPDGSEFRQAVLDTFHESMNHMAHFDFDDQKWMPLHYDWKVPSYDQVVLDEFQDTCPVELELMMRACPRGQFTAIGDPDQTIYGFKGAAPDIFTNFITKTQAKELPLSICYRCPKAVIKAAQAIVPRIEWAENAPEGCVDHIPDRDFGKMVRPGDFVLCRTTDELVAKCIALIRMGIQAKVRGRDFGESLLWIVRAVGLNWPIEDFMTRLYAFAAERIQKLQAMRQENQILNLEDRINTIAALAEGCSRSADILKQAERIFTDEPHSGVDLMTIHKAKGLQAKRVLILRPDLLPHPRSKERAWMAAEERRLKYVAITRSQDELFWVNPEPRRKSNYWL